MTRRKEGTTTTTKISNSQWADAVLYRVQSKSRKRYKGPWWHHGMFSDVHHDMVMQRSTCCHLMCGSLLGVGFRKMCSFVGFRQHYSPLVYPGFCWICYWGWCLKKLYCHHLVAPRKHTFTSRFNAELHCNCAVYLWMKITFSLILGFFGNTFLNHNKSDRVR